MTSRKRLRRLDGRLYLERWGWDSKWCGIYVHHITATDNGIDLHDHPWAFGSFILWGSYSEIRCPTRQASQIASSSYIRGYRVHRPLWSWKWTPMTDAHRIDVLHQPSVWTLVLRGPRLRHWGFYEPRGFVDWRTHKAQMVDEAAPSAPAKHVHRRSW